MNTRPEKFEPTNKRQFTVRALSRVLLCGIVLFALLLPLGCGGGNPEERTQDTYNPGGYTSGSGPSTNPQADNIKKYKDKTPVEIWKNGNDFAIDGGGGTPPQVVQDRAYYVFEIYTYHWNSGNGDPVAGTISLKASDGTMYGPWPTEIYNGVYWHAILNEVIPAGTYTLIDSNPKTWAQNGGSKGTGMGWANGTPAE